ncbi:hypothetical protein [Brevundimonas sp.]|jgi:hypothetical protein|uniref:hypothetical protein n=1 Tax=Brevundimonas sp. TaxID=1871086 RepID=UPI0037BEEC98
MPESRVTVRNRSATASAANVRVDIGFSAFGIGMPVTTVGAQFVSLAASAAADLLFPLPQALLAGDPLVSVFVQITHGADAETGNNHGEQAVIGAHTSEAGRDIVFKIPVRNPDAYPRILSFVTFANTLGFTVTPTGHAFAPLEQIIVEGRIKVAPGLHASPDTIEQTATMAALDASGALVGGVSCLVRIDD